MTEDKGRLRFRGNAIEVDGGWGWRLLITFESGSNGDPIKLKAKDVFINREKALENLKSAIKEIAADMQKKAMGAATETYMDYKENKIRRWDKADEH